MKRGYQLLTVVAVCLSILLGAVGPAYAITGGQPDGDGHPYVGFAIFLADATPVNSCSGVLVAPQMFVTAAHCALGANGAIVTFAAQPNIAGLMAGDMAGWVAGGPITHPAFGSNPAPGLPNFLKDDLAVVLLFVPQAGPFAVLPTEGQVDGLAMGTDVTIVGYGALAPAHGKQPAVVNGLRNVASTHLVASNQAWHDTFVKLTANPGQDKGGTCQGDSGGPALLGDTVIAITSYGVSPGCNGLTYAARLDTAGALGFIGNPMGQ